MIKAFTKDAIVDAARSVVGTPYHHQGRIPEIGLDCVGVIVIYARCFGLELKDPANYSFRPKLETCLEYLTLNNIKKVESPEFGDILLFHKRRVIPPHFAIHLKDTIVHCPSVFVEERGIKSKVVEAVYSEKWKGLLHSAWRIFLKVGSDYYLNVEEG
jgi:cell wall-associated NlpC family hydrolase